MDSYWRGWFITNFLKLDIVTILFPPIYYNYILSINDCRLGA